jgi:hypothetical protein
MDEVTSNESSTPSTTSQQVDPFLDKQVDPWVWSICKKADAFFVFKFFFSKTTTLYIP